MGLEDGRQAALELSVNVNTTDATAGATALLLPAQNTHTLHERERKLVGAHVWIPGTVLYMWFSLLYNRKTVLRRFGGGVHKRLSRQPSFSPPVPLSTIHPKGSIHPRSFSPHPP